MNLESGTWKSFLKGPKDTLFVKNFNSPVCLGTFAENSVCVLAWLVLGTLEFTGQSGKPVSYR